VAGRARGASGDGRDVVARVRGFGLRRCRYIGLAKARLQHAATAAAINVDRIPDWSGGAPRATTRTSPFARLVA
jgi:transposase